MIKHGQEKRPFLKYLIPCLHFSKFFKNLENLGGVKLKHLLEIQNPRLEVQGLAARPVALLSRAQRTEVLHRLGHVVAKQSHLYPPRPSTIDIDVEKHLFIVEGSGFRI